MWRIPPGMRAVMDTQRQMHTLIDVLQACVVGIRVRCSGQMGHYHSQAPYNQGATHPFSIPPFFICLGTFATNSRT